MKIKFSNRFRFEDVFVIKMDKIFRKYFDVLYWPYSIDVYHNINIKMLKSDK